ncbi:SMI1/KNR4 family protein [Chryseobacterium sp. NFX27]|uniref:SMI1/KNR4 family protein n=1 Tax=Chryseobacterium sp. NFX27 TaxID=2819618 RepID=UPI003CECC232
MAKIITLVELDKNIIAEKINAFEAEYNFKLHFDLKELILDYNVCKPIKTFYKNNKVQFNLNYFFGISDDKFQSLSENYYTYTNRMPDELFPIGSVDGGDLLCMHKKTGEIYYWFHEQDDWGLEGIDHWPIKVANHLEEYINDLILPELPTQQEIEIAKKNSKVKITPISVKIKNEQREKQGLPPLSFEEWDALLNG